jgi:hypothetical protein
LGGGGVVHGFTACRDFWWGKVLRLNYLGAGCRIARGQGCLGVDLLQNHGPRR